jgi:hypothetical protein
MNTLHSSNSLNTSLRAQPRLLMPAHRRDCPRQVLRPAMPKLKTQPNMDVFDGLKHAALIGFVRSVFDEPECRLLLEGRGLSSGSAGSLGSVGTVGSAGAPGASGSTGTIVAPPLQRLRAAAWSTCLYPSGSRIQTDVIYAATLILGLQNLLKASGDQGGDGVLSNSAASDVFFTICHPALRRLESQAPVHAALLRVALNWGNVDEMLDEEAQRMQSIVRQASRVCAGRLHLKKRLRFMSNGEVAHG